MLNNDVGNNPKNCKYTLTIMFIIVIIRNDIERKTQLSTTYLRNKLKLNVIIIKVQIIIKPLRWYYICCEYKIKSVLEGKS